MDQTIVDIVKLAPKRPKIITIVAENFSFLEDQARFLKATLDIPAINKLTFVAFRKVLVQIGPQPLKLVEGQVSDGTGQAKDRWTLLRYDSYSEISDANELFAKLTNDLKNLSERSVIFFNDFSRLELLFKDRLRKIRDFLAMVENLKLQRGHIFLLLYQNSCPNASSSLLKDLSFLSDGMSRVISCKVGYFISSWWQTVPKTSTSLPGKVNTQYFTCKIGKHYWDPVRLCFYERKDVTKTYNPETDTDIALDKESDDAVISSDTEEINGPDNEDNMTLSEDATKPFMKAQNPEKSSVFTYIPDREDDIDEDDPDNDLGF